MQQPEDWAVRRREARSVECQAGRIQGLGAELPRKNTSLRTKSPHSSPALLCSFPRAPSPARRPNTACCSFPICQTRPTPQSTQEGKLGRMQGFTGYSPFGIRQTPTPCTAPTLPSVTLVQTQNLPVLGSSTWKGGSSHLPGKTAVTVVRTQAAGTVLQSCVI